MVRISAARRRRVRHPVLARSPEYTHDADPTRTRLDEAARSDLVDQIGHRAAERRGGPVVLDDRRKATLADVRAWAADAVDCRRRAPGELRRGAAGLAG